ncbi:hypothetical protein IEO21_02030 [Rhodonia placenta]|uniref:N-acetyltransferase domain-containing protein n=1 Tax=Rhodonia placenta TaxID=104341 RepID=A0A8H7P8X1_9APHY|nr:hypothetical protein IEO21_02030 [Postia placenta]
MSAYGAIQRTASSEPLASTIWHLKDKGHGEHDSVTIHHLTLSRARSLPGLVEYLHAVFADELARGLTYPQEILPGETYTQETFEAYYFAADVLVAVQGESENTLSFKHPEGQAVSYGIDAERNGRRWEACVAGCYYVKPNYPGRSSHICNAGFLVPVSQRAKGVGAALARSFLHYAPRLGYEASVFNLVFVNNTASVRLWESLNFTKAGLIPRAGRLKKADGSPDEEESIRHSRYRTDARECAHNVPQTANLQLSVVASSTMLSPGDGMNKQDQRKGQSGVQNVAQINDNGDAGHIDVPAEGLQLTPTPSPEPRTPRPRPRFLERSYGPSPGALPPDAVFMLKTPRLPPDIQPESASACRPAAAERHAAAHRAATPSPIARPPVFFPPAAAPLGGQSRPQVAVTGPSRPLTDRPPVFTLSSKPGMPALAPPRTQGLVAAPADAAEAAANAPAPVPQPSRSHRRDSDPAAEEVLEHGVTTMGEHSQRDLGYFQRSRALCEQAGDQLYTILDLRKQVFQEKALRIRMLTYILRWQKVESLWSEEALGEHVEDILAEDGGASAALQGEIEAVWEAIAKADGEGAGGAKNAARSRSGRARDGQHTPVLDQRILQQIDDAVRDPVGFPGNATQKRRRSEDAGPDDEPQGSKRARSSAPHAGPSQSDVAASQKLSKGKGKARMMSPLQEEPEEANVEEEQECATVIAMLGILLSDSEEEEGEEDGEDDDDDNVPALVAPVQDAPPPRQPSPPIDRPVRPVPRRSPSIGPARQPQSQPVYRQSTRLRARTNGRA